MVNETDPIAEARRLLAELDGEWGYTKGRDNWDIHSEKKRGSAWVAEVFDERDAALIAAAPRLLAALCDRLEANEGETRTAERPDSTLDYWRTRALAAERRPQIRCPLCTDKHDPETDCAE